MADVDCGSKTPGMVQKVLAWRKQNSRDAERLWTALQAKNDALAVELVRLENDTSPPDYQTLRSRIADVRMLLREMSECADVAIEPKAQTDLLDACAGLGGVIGGVTPGAGGYDAIALLIEDKEETLESLSKFLERWKFGDEGERNGRVRLLDVREEMEGVRKEDPEQYEKWTR